MSRALLLARNSGLVFLLSAAIVGAVLRFQHIPGFAFGKYGNILHTHSHIAILGWIFNVLFYLTVNFWLAKEGKDIRRYNILLICFLVADAGMMVSFPLQGYGSVSIAFSAIHIVLQFIYTWWFFGGAPASDKHSTSLKLIKYALFFQLFSALGAVMAGPVGAAGYAGKPVYYICIYFYMHFQYNGWMIFSLLALLVYFIEHSGFKFDRAKCERGARILFYSVFPAFALMTLWTVDSLWLILVAGAGIILQLFSSVIILLSCGSAAGDWISEKSGAIRLLMTASLTAFLIKTLLQTFSMVPQIAHWVSTERNVVISYIHLFLLGMVTTFLIAVLLILKQTRKGMAGAVMFLISFALTELILAITPFAGYTAVRFSPPVLAGLALLQFAGLFQLGFVLLRKCETDAQ